MQRQQRLLTASFRNFLLSKLHVSTLIVIGDVIVERMQMLLNPLKPDSGVKGAKERSYAKYGLCIINAPRHTHTHTLKPSILFRMDSWRQGVFLTSKGCGVKLRYGG